MFMAEKIAYTIKRHLTTNAQLVAQELIDTYGSMKSVLSAAVFALKNSSPEQREKAFSDATKKTEKPPIEQASPEEMLEKLKTEFAKEQSNKTMLSSADVAKILADFRTKMAPSQEEKLQHLKRNKA
jgi:hypothetical protein